MKTASVPSVMSPSTAGLGVLAIAVLTIALTGAKVPLLSNLRISLVLFIVLGMTVCTSGIGRVAALGEWSHPLSIVGYVLGGLILLIAIAVFAGMKLPLIGSDRQALIAVAILSGVKILNSLIHSLLSHSG
ncbi:MAG: hypothetical protein MUF84_14860 [Anaerolineae bacterium]|nr:hypothetical protein [Anaerolineae bacterium]